ncbi:Calx-beta domain-containing protein [Pseudoalteromonas prydzensis]|uniref:Calx-beta domain-containing protein n=1 Tax=Pseudoalteromonas prydzensis TaxID=182141 RepID=UPI003FD2F0F1
MNILKTVTLPLLASASFIASASSLDVRQNYGSEQVLQQHLPSMYQFAGVKTVKAMSVPSVEVVVFYQPSYASAFGEYNVYNRSVDFINTFNEALTAHGLVDYKVIIKDIVPVQSVPDSAPYVEFDKNGQVTQGGAESLFSLAALNEDIMLNGELIKSPEYEIYQNKWKADLVLYLREQRAGDPHLGLAGIGGEYSSAVDIGGDSKLYTTIAHEIGHNFGLNHEEGKANKGPEYARAWQCGGKQTMMYSSSAQATTLRHFSDPNITNGGQACGDEGKAYNAKVLVDNYAATSQRREGVVESGTVTFKDVSFSGNESEGVAITLIRNGDFSVPASVKVFAENGSALWGEDFTTSFVLAEFEAGQTQAEIVYPFVNDGIDEGVETLKMHLKYPYKLAVGAQSEAAITLLDGDSQGAGGVVSIYGPSQLEEGKEIKLTITRAGGVGEIVVNVKTQSDNAVEGTDYIPLNENIIFKEGVVEQQVSVTTPSNDVAEIDKTVTVTLTSPNAGVEFDVRSHVINLIDDDASGAGTFDMQGNKTVSESAGSYSLTIKREGGFAATSVKVTSSVKGVDTVTTVAFNQNETEKTVAIPFTDNNVEESNYQMTINLSSDDAGALINTSSLVVEIIDNDAAGNSNGGESSGGSLGFLSLLIGAGLAGRRKLKK